MICKNVGIKKRNKKFNPLIFILSAVFLSSFSTHLSPQLIVPKESWKLVKTVDNVDFFYLIKDCKGERTVFLKLNNKNKHAVKVSWNEVFETQQKVTVKGLNGKKTLTLAAGQTLQAGCDNAVAKECIIPASKISPAFKADVSKYEITDVSVSGS